jgi:hypothetical protein
VFKYLRNIDMCVVSLIFIPLTLIHEFSTSPNGEFLVFLSAKCAVDSGVHNATNSLHRIDWSTDRKLYQSAKIYDIVSSSCGIICMYWFDCIRLVNS